MKKLSICLSILAATLVVAGTASAAPVVLNGSFESPDISSGSISNGGTNWTPSSTTGVFLIDNASGAGVTPFGSQFVALNSGQSDSQTISGFNLGQIYTFDLYFADLFNGANPSLTVTLSGVISLNQTFTAPVGGGYGNSAIPFTHVTLTLPALTLNGSITLTLTDSTQQLPGRLRGPGNCRLRGAQTPLLTGVGGYRLATLSPLCSTESEAGVVVSGFRGITSWNPWASSLPSGAQQAAWTNNNSPVVLRPAKVRKKIMGSYGEEGLSVFGSEVKL